MRYPRGTNCRDDYAKPNARCRIEQTTLDAILKDLEAFPSLVYTNYKDFLNKVSLQKEDLFIRLVGTFSIKGSLTGRPWYVSKRSLLIFQTLIVSPWGRRQKNDTGFALEDVSRQGLSREFGILKPQTIEWHHTETRNETVLNVAPLTDLTESSSLRS